MFIINILNTSNYMKDIIKKWIGEVKTFPELESDDFDAGYAKLHADLTSRIPELEEMIKVEIIRELHLIRQKASKNQLKLIAEITNSIRKVL